jgi:hypothetical protein
LLGGPKSATRQSYIGFRLGNRSRTLDSVPSLFQSLGMRGRRDPHDDPPPARPRPPPPPVPTLGQLLHQPYWVWLRCNACGHIVAVALVPFVLGASTCISKRARFEARLSTYKRQGRNLIVMDSAGALVCRCVGGSSCCTSANGLGCAKTKSDLVVMPSGRRIFAFFCSPHDQRLYRVEFLHSQVIAAEPDNDLTVEVA